MFNTLWCSVWCWSMDVQCSMVTWEGWAWLCTKGPMLNVAPGGLQRLQRITVFGTHQPPEHNHHHLNSRRRKSALHPCCSAMQNNAVSDKYGEVEQRCSRLVHQRWLQLSHFSKLQNTGQFFSLWYWEKSMMKNQQLYTEKSAYMCWDFSNNWLSLFLN